MTLKASEKRLLLIAAVAVPAMLTYYFSGKTTASAPLLNESIPSAEARLDRLRKVAATVPAKREALKQAQAELALREKAVIHADTAPEAQAHLLEVARRLANAEQIELKQNEFGQPKPFGNDYGLVTAATSFECRIEQFLNFMAALSREPDLLAPAEIRIGASGNRPKYLYVRLLLSGVVPRKLVPEKKGFASF